MKKLITLIFIMMLSINVCAADKVWVKHKKGRGKSLYVKTDKNVTVTYVLMTDDRKIKSYKLKCIKNEESTISLKDVVSYAVIKNRKVLSRNGKITGEFLDKINEVKKSK